MKDLNEITQSFSELIDLVEDSTAVMKGGPEKANQLEWLHKAREQEKKLREGARNYGH